MFQQNNSHILAIKGKKIRSFVLWHLLEKKKKLLEQQMKMIPGARFLNLRKYSEKNRINLDKYLYRILATLTIYMLGNSTIQYIYFRRVKNLVFKDQTVPTLIFLSFGFRFPPNFVVFRKFPRNSRNKIFWKKEQFKCRECLTFIHVIFF